MSTARPLRTALVTSVTVLALTSCNGVDAADSANEGPDAEADVELVMDEMSYQPDHIEVPAGETVTVRLVNAGNLRHDLVLPDGTESPVVQPGESEIVEIGPLESATKGWCSVPGHQAQGMELSIDVVE